MRYVFQESKIFEAGDPVDTARTKKVIKAKTEARARSLLPRPETGRRWILVETRDGT